MGICGSNEIEGEGDVAADDKQMFADEKLIEQNNTNLKPGSQEFLEMTKFPVILLDTSGSMACETISASSQVPKMVLAKQICANLCARLATIDDADRLQQAPGVPLITFNTFDGGVDRGFLHPGCFEQEWANIEFHAGTHIMDAWRAMLKRYRESFESRPKGPAQWPLLLTLVLTDGELKDGHEFEQHLKHIKGSAFVEVAVIGYGEEHDRACEHYQRISRSHPHVRVTQFTNCEDIDMIVQQLLTMVNPALLKQTKALPAPVAAVNPYASGQI